MMKSTFLIYAALLGICSCQIENITVEQGSVLNDDSVYSVLRTKALESGDYSEFLVNESDLESYISSLNKTKDDGRGKVNTVTPVLHEGQIVYYVINFDEGWQLLSVDKRGPIILAYNREGSYSPEEVTPEKETMINTLVDDMEYRWVFPEDYYTNCGDEAIEYENYCLTEWDAINGSTNFVRANRIQTKGPDDPLDDPPGHYEVWYMYSDTIQYNSVPHLLTTAWHQQAPYNDYAPLMRDSVNVRCPIGCITIATAQVINYLHYYLGVPTTSPTQGYCYGDEDDNPPLTDFWAYSDTTWSYFDTPFDMLSFMPKFVGDVAKRLRINFHHDGSTTPMINVSSLALPYFGIGASYLFGFNATSVYNNLKDGLPVIYGANAINNLFDWPGHTFVIDGYTEYVTRTHYFYTWVYDLPPNPGGGNPTVPTPPDDYEEIVVSSPFLKYFHLNWGDGVVCSNNYALNGNWSQGTNPPYQYFKEMVYGLYVL